MKREQQIADLIREIAQSGAYEIHQGFVQEVSSDGTCVVEIDTDVSVSGVRLNVLPNMDYGIELRPKKGSACVIGRIENGTNYQLIQCAELDAYRLRIGNMLLEINGQDAKWNEGKQGGMVLLNPLITELKKIDTNLTILRQATSAVAQAVNAQAPGTGAAFELAVSTMQAVNTTQLENQKLKQ